MSKEARFSSSKMSKRLVANSEVTFSADETNSDMPAFLRKTSDEGRGGGDQSTPLSDSDSDSESREGQGAKY